MLLAKRRDRKGSWLSVPLNTHIWLGKITCTQQCCNALHSVACEQALHFKWWANAWVSSKAWSGGGKGELATITYKFSFLLHPDKAKYHWLKNNIPEVKLHWWQSWQTHHKFLLMLSEISWVDCSLSGEPEVFLRVIASFSKKELLARKKIALSFHEKLLWIMRWLFFKVSLWSSSMQLT